MAVGTAPKVGFLERRVTFFSCFLTLDDSERRLSFRVPFVFASDVQVHWSDDCGLLNFRLFPISRQQQNQVCVTHCVLMGAELILFTFTCCLWPWYPEVVGPTNALGG